MPIARKVKTNHEVNGNSNLSKALQEMQGNYVQQIGKQKRKIQGYGPEIITRGTEVLHKTVIDNLPSELLDMKYGEFLKQMDGLSFSVGKQNDTLAAIEDLRNKVTSGTATPGEIIKYRELKKLL